MARIKLVDGKPIELSTEEETARDAEETSWKNTELDRSLKRLRFERNQKLIETDYLALSDQTLTDAMKTYRQELRDITNGLDTVDKVNEKLEKENGNFKNFPTKP